MDLGSRWRFFIILTVGQLFQQPPNRGFHLHLQPKSIEKIYFALFLWKILILDYWKYTNDGTQHSRSSRSRWAKRRTMHNLAETIFNEFSELGQFVAQNLGFYDENSGFFGFFRFVTNFEQL